MAREDGIDDLAGHKTVVAGAVDHFDFAHAVKELIEDAGAKTADGRLAFAGNTAGSGAIPAFLRGASGVDILEEFREEAGRILTIGIHGGNKIARGVFEAGEESGFFAEVAGEGNVEDAGVMLGEGFHDFEGVVAAAVVNEDEFEIVVRESVDGFERFLIKERERSGLVITGDDDADSLHTFIIS